jgi:hypothetical protein
MIEPTSLRLGNLVYKSLKSGQGRTNICTIDIYELIRIVEDTGSFNYEPIPLTEELLLRFGFEKHESALIQSYSISISPYKNLKELSLTIQGGNEYIYIREGENEYPSTADIVTTLVNADITGRPFYAHQIQNLYYSLTNQELKLEGL